MAHQLVIMSERMRNLEGLGAPNPISKERVKYQRVHHGNDLSKGRRNEMWVKYMAT